MSVDELIAEAEQRGREDNADHAMCYVHGSVAYEALIRHARAAALRDAAEHLPIVRDVLLGMAAREERGDE